MTELDATVRLTEELTRFPSVSVDSNLEISDYLETILRQSGFEIERLTYDTDGKLKVCLIGKRGTGHGGWAYMAHTDVVPADSWSGPTPGPFQPAVRDGRIYGRGTCDMKGSIACALSAIRSLPSNYTPIPIYVILTADEEVGQGGAYHVRRYSQLFQEMVRHGTRGVIGEPTCLRPVYAHKGTCLVRVTSRGVAGHSSGRLGRNANLAMIPFLYELRDFYTQTETDACWWDSRFDPPSISMNIGINDHTSAVNITPPRSVCTIFFRPMPGQDAQRIIQTLIALATQHGLEAEVLRHEPPFEYRGEQDYVHQVLELAKTPQAQTVNYGTDASYLGCLPELLILGPGSIDQAHTDDEYISLDDLQAGTQLYRRLIEWECQRHG